MNTKGVEFYDNLINLLIASGITPFVTLYHWDLPFALSQRGGWSSREVVDAFVAYATFCFDHFGDRVKLWGTFNEPFIFTMFFASEKTYNLYDNDDGKRFTFKREIQASHLVNVVHARAVAAYRNCQYNDGKIGIVRALAPVYEHGALVKEPTNSKHAESLLWWLDPLFKGNYPPTFIAGIRFCVSNPKLPKTTWKR